MPFGWPLRGAIRSLMPVLGFHHPQVAIALAALTSPRRRGLFRPAEQMIVIDCVVEFSLDLR